MSKTIQILETARKIYRGIHDCPGSLLTSLDGAWAVAQSSGQPVDESEQKAFVDGLLPLICRANGVELASGVVEAAPLHGWAALQRSKGGSLKDGEAVFSKTLDILYADLERTAGPDDRHFFDACRMNFFAPKNMREDLAMRNLARLQGHLVRAGVDRVEVTMIGANEKCDFEGIRTSPASREDFPVAGFLICRETSEGWVEEELDPLPMSSVAARVAVQLADMAYDNWASDDGATIRTAIGPDGLKAGVRWMETIEMSETGYQVPAIGRLRHNEGGPDIVTAGMEP